MKYLYKFLKKPKEFVENITAKQIFIIFFLNLITKNVYNILSSHPFIPEMSFNFAGIEKPTFLDFVFSSLLSEFLFLVIFAGIFLINIKAKSLPKLIFNLMFVIASLYLIKTDGKFFIFLYTSAIFMLLMFSIFKNMQGYIIIIKILISIHILNIATTIFLYISELVYLKALFIMAMFVYSILSFGYFVNLLKNFFEMSIKKIIIYSTLAMLFTIAYGYAVYKLDIFTSNTVKLLLYQ